MSNLSFTVSPEAVASIHDEGLVILDTGSGHLYASNGTGARIWRGVEQQLSVDVMAKEISGHYGITKAAARQEVVSFLDQLEQHSLIRRERAL